MGGKLCLAEQDLPDGPHLSLFGYALHYIWYRRVPRRPVRLLNLRGLYAGLTGRSGPLGSLLPHEG